jgi:hypothetical protein
MTCAIIGLPQTAAALRRLVPSASIRCMMTASLRASATLAFFIPLRLASFIAQLFNAVQPLSGLVRMMWAPSYRAARTQASPIFEMRPSMFVSPD